METNLARARSWLVQQGDVINWDYRGSPDAYVGASTAGLDLFTYDFMAHPRHSVAGALTRLPLPDNAVDIAVCANFLFAYSEMSDATETVSAPRLAQAASSDLLAGVGGTSSSIWPVVHAERRALVEDLVGLEAANITAFTELYRGHPFISIPEVISEASGDRVLTMTYLDGMDWAAAGCTCHEQKVLDWELGQAGRRWKRQYGLDAIDQIRRRWDANITAAGRDLYFFVGNQHQHRGSFSVLGTWWPREASSSWGCLAD